MSSFALEGIRVIELTTGAAGPTVAKCLGEYGAEVIKIESHQRPDSHRGGPLAQGVVGCVAVGERRGDDGERGRGDERGAQALDRAGDDQPQLALGEAARGRRDDHQRAEGAPFANDQSVVSLPADGAGSSGRIPCGRCGPPGAGRGRYG